MTGGLKSFGKKRYINVNHIRNVKDSHEVYFHTLEAIAVNLIIERGPVSLRLPSGSHLTPSFESLPTPVLRSNPSL